MTIAQRLTRAGLTFVLLGFVAVTLPESGIAQAITGTGKCANGNSHTYAVYPDGGSTSALSYTFPSATTDSTQLIDVTQDGASTPFTFTYSGDKGKISAMQMGNQIQTKIIGSGNGKSITITVTFTNAASGTKTLQFTVSD